METHLYKQWSTYIPSEWLGGFKTHHLQGFIYLFLLESGKNLPPTIFFFSNATAQCLNSQIFDLHYFFKSVVKGSKDRICHIVDISQLTNSVPFDKKGVILIVFHLKRNQQTDIQKNHL